MRVLTWEELSASRRAEEPIAAAIGVFDGLHIGHKELVRRVLGREGLVPAVVTFAVNPKRILSPSTFHGELSTLDQRLALIDSIGVELCVLIDFSGEFSKLPGRHFLSMLSESGGLRFLAVGSDFRCGHRLDTGADDIREFCVERSIEVEFLKAVQWSGRPVSSSRIRKAVLEGRLEDAAGMLGRPYEIDLSDAQRTETGGFAPSGAQASPPAGVYEAYPAHQGAARTFARLGSDGSWIFAGSPGRDRAGLRLIHMVSRE
jgi:riboflavin kinase/FMN adenylyltransferase